MENYETGTKNLKTEYEIEYSMSTDDKRERATAPSLHCEKYRNFT